MTIKTKTGQSYNRRAWTGGDTQPAGYYSRCADYRDLVRAYWRDQVADCGGLGLWACAGTTSLVRARIFWNRARLDAWRTLNA